jgi:2Fe-2S ferredoxin
MPLIFYVTHAGNMYEAEVAIGDSVMNGAVENMIDGILGECGGVMSCGTCHCHVDEKWQDKTAKPTSAELEMLKASHHYQANSRLSCQLKVTAEMEGLTVHLPESQY